MIWIFFIPRKNSQVEAAIRNHEVAYKMQAAVPELCDLKGETEATKMLYGLDSTDVQTAGYARQCLLARGWLSVELDLWNWFK